MSLHTDPKQLPSRAPLEAASAMFYSSGRKNASWSLARSESAGAAPTLRERHLHAPQPSILTTALPTRHSKALLHAPPAASSTRRLQLSAQDDEPLPAGWDEVEASGYTFAADGRVVRELPRFSRTLTCSRRGKPSVTFADNSLSTAPPTAAVLHAEASDAADKFAFTFASVSEAHDKSPLWSPESCDLSKDSPLPGLGEEDADFTVALSPPISWDDWAPTTESVVNPAAARLFSRDGVAPAHSFPLS